MSPLLLRSVPLFFRRFDEVPIQSPQTLPPLRYRMISAITLSLDPPHPWEFYRTAADLDDTRSWDQPAFAGSQAKVSTRHDWHNRSGGIRAMDISTRGPGRTRDSGGKHLLDYKGIRPYVPIHALLISLSMISRVVFTRIWIACARLAAVASSETSFAHLQSPFVLSWPVLECYSLSGGRKKGD